LFELVRADSLYERPIPERHRIIFYVGHLEAFDRNLLSGRLVSPASSDPDLDRLFAFGIDPVGGGLPTDQRSDWPALDQVRQYVQRTRQLDQGLASLRPGPFRTGDFLPRCCSTSPLSILMHSTLAYMLHRCPTIERRRPVVLGLPWCLTFLR
jgi:hypothetical protein